MFNYYSKSYNKLDLGDNMNKYKVCVYAIPVSDSLIII